jgi:hypothetical protein
MPSSICNNCRRGEICNGGFYQYFGNSTAQSYHFLAVKAFGKIGAHKIAALLEEVLETILKQSRTFRRSYLVDGIQDAFNEANDVYQEINIDDFDSRFYRLVDEVEDLNQLREQYIFNNLQDFE